MTSNDDRVPVQRFAASVAVELIAITITIALAVVLSSLLGRLWPAIADWIQP